MNRPRLTILGGPNGAGKTTLAKYSYADLLEIDRFLNADEFAAELSPNAPGDKAIAAAADNYLVSLVFLWVSDPDICVQRVADRVSQGGHYIPSDVVKRRHTVGLRLLPEFLDVAEDADIFDANALPKLIARRRSGTWRVYEADALPGDFPKLA